ncbi:MAG: bifunctional DNA primase/polymerase [Planctomycetota bacterium]|nr:MAG: bifunctional DNA primase/polymerase [Planctomycetota bacterium]
MGGQGPSLLDAARAYTARGYRVVPIPPAQKAPRIKAWQNLRLDEPDLPAHFNCDPSSGNVGLLLGEPSGGLVNVDLDCDEAVDLSDDYLPPTPATTGRPSRPNSHRWYVSAGVATTKHRDPVTREMIVELRSTGAQTVIGPSVHPSGEPYDLLEAEPARVAGPLLAACVAALAEAVVRARHGQGARAGPPTPERGPTCGKRALPEDGVERRAAAYLDAMPPAVSGQGGHNATYAAATAMVHGFGLDAEAALRLLLGRYNPRCEPPWSEKELRHKVEDAASKPHDKPFGWLRDSGAD